MCLLPMLKQRKNSRLDDNVQNWLAGGYLIFAESEQCFTSEILLWRVFWAGVP